MNEDAAQPSRWSRWRRWNWWRIGFFVLLVLFEFTREIAVLESDPPPKIATLAWVGSYGPYTSAKGRWVRIDGRGTLVPVSVSIQCDRSEGQCVEITANIINGYLGEPNADTFDATFTPEAVSYENDNPDCAHYSVRIDLKLKKVFAVRERKDNPKNENCRNLERRIEMTLGDGFQPDENPLGDHFVPFIRVIGWFFK